MKKGSVATTLFIIALCFYLIASVMLGMGYDKMTNYYNSEYSTSRNVNAYVGGDAYNYIINGNYATGFFVLSMGFMLGGTVSLCGGLIVSIRPDVEEPTNIPPESEASNTNQPVAQEGAV